MAVMGAIADLWKSERGLVAIVLIAACSVLFGLGRIPIEAWTEYTKWIFVTYVAGKTITGSVALVTKSPREPKELGVTELIQVAGQILGPRPPAAPPVDSPPTSTASASAA